MSRTNVFTYRYPTCANKEELNFIGFVIRNFTVIRGGEDVGFKSDCSDETKNTYVGLYNEYIFPMIDPDLPMSSYNTEKLESILEKIQKRNRYLDTTMSSTFHSLLFDPYKYYVEYVLGQQLDEKEKDDEKRKKKLCHIPKSMSFAEIERFEQLSMKPDTEVGELVGLAIMRFTGNRCNEVCGYNFGDFTRMQEYTTGYKVIMDKSTKINTNALKSGGKTSNAPRWIPVPTKLYDFLQQRKKHISSLITFPYEWHDRTYENVDQLPAACRRYDFGNRCTTGDLSRKGKELLTRVISREAVEETVRFLNDPNLEIEPEDKDPTTYLLRRSYLTELLGKGVMMEDETFVAGHELYDSSMKRWDYVDEFCLHPIWEKLEYQPEEKDGYYCFLKPIDPEVLVNSTFCNMFQNEVFIRKEN